jgi:hypothetical protein
VEIRPERRYFHKNYDHGKETLPCKMSYHVDRHAGRYNSRRGYRKQVKGWLKCLWGDRRNHIEKMHTKTGMETGTLPFNDKLLFLILNSFIFGGDFKSVNPDCRITHPFICNKDQPSLKYRYESGYYYVKT